MMKSKGKNKKYIFWTAAIGLFGIAGLLLVPAAMYIIKLSDRYPKVFRWILFNVFAFIWLQFTRPPVEDRKNSAPLPPTGLPEV